MAYARQRPTTKTTYGALLFSKPELALIKSAKIPRRELSTAVPAVRVLEVIKKLYPLPSDRWRGKDTTIVFYYIADTSSRFSTFNKEMLLKDGVCWSAADGSATLVSDGKVVKVLLHSVGLLRPYTSFQRSRVEKKLRPFVRLLTCPRVSPKVHIDFFVMAVMRSVGTERNIHLQGHQCRWLSLGG